MQLFPLTATSILVADESSDTTCFVCFFTAATGVLEAKTGTNLTFNSANGTLGVGNLELPDGGFITTPTPGPKIEFDETNGYIEITGANVGIGTTSPAATLHVQNVGEPGIRFTRTDIVGNQSWLFRVLSTSAFVIRDVTNSDNVIKIDPNVGDDRINILSARTVFNDAGEDRDFRVEAVGKVNAFFIEGSSGEVGIGTGTPDAKLDIETSVTDAIGIRVDGFTNDYTANTTSYLVFAKRDLDLEQTGRTDYGIYSELNYIDTNFLDVTSYGTYSVINNTGGELDPSANSAHTYTNMVSSSSVDFIVTAQANVDTTVVTTGLLIDLNQGADFDENGQAASLIATNYGINIDIDIDDALTTNNYITNTYGIYVDILSSDDGTPTNYGLYINSIAGASTNYSIYSNSTAPSVFKGDIHILADDKKIFWGAGDDWSAYYDNTNMNFSGTGGLIIDTYLSVGNDNTPSANNIIRVRNDTGNASQKGCSFELDTTNAGGTYSQDAVFGNIRLFGAGALSDITAVRGVITAQENATQTVANARIFEAQPNFGGSGHAGDITAFSNFYGGAIGTFTGAGNITTAYGMYLGDVTGGSTNYAIYTNSGQVRFGDEVEAGGSTTKIKLTSLGGYAIKLTNKTGGNTIAGQLVNVYTATAIDDAFKTISANDENIIGIVLDAGVADGSEAWVVISGIGDVLMDAGGSARGDRIISSATAGSADVWNVGGAVATHFQEIGHCIETRTGAGLARCILHFN